MLLFNWLIKGVLMSKVGFMMKKDTYIHVEALYISQIWWIIVSLLYKCFKVFLFQFL